MIHLEFNFAILISGFKSLCEPHAKYYDDIPYIDIPSLHIYGENDQVVPTGRIVVLFIDNEYFCIYLH